METQMEISGNPFDNLKNLYQSMPSLIKLDLSFNIIYFIQPGSLLQVGGLRKLTLSGNHLQTLQFGVFDGVKALDFLNLSSNALQRFDVNEIVKLSIGDKENKIRVNDNVNGNNSNMKSDDIRSETKITLKEEINTLRGEFIKAFQKSYPFQLAQETKDDKVVYIIAAGLDLVLIIILYSTKYTKGFCQFAELPRLGDACVATLTCDHVLNVPITSWDCIRTVEDVYDTDYYGYRRNRHQRVNYATNYKLYVTVTEVDDQNDVFENVADKMNNIITFQMIDGNMLALPQKVYQLTEANKIVISNNHLSAVDLNRFVALTKLTIINFSNNTISNLEMASQARSMPSRSIKTVDLSQNILKTIPNTCFSLFPELQHLNLSHNLIRSFDILTFEGVMELKMLDISHNMLFEIGNSFTRFKDLNELYLQNNKLDSLLDYNLNTLLHLEKLNLSSNVIDKFETNAFKSLVKLEYLDLGYNKIELIPKKIFETNINLHSLIISNNKVSHIENGAFDGKNITEFNVQDNNLTGSIEQDTFKGVYVTELDLSDGKITSLGNETFKYMCNDLKSLNISYNLINSISNSAFNCLELLTTLDLSNNHLEQLHFETSNLTRLTMLYVRNNKIKKINKGMFENLVSLKSLDLSNNEITEIELQTFARLENIDSLSVTHNPFLNILENNTFNGMIALKSVDLTFSRTTSYQNGSFSGLPALKYVNASFGQLSSIAYNAFIQTGSIEKLDFSHNLLDTFHINTSSIPKIEELYLNDNALRHITNDTFSGLKLLRMLNLVNNNIQRIEANALKNIEQLSHLYLSSNMQMEIIGNPFDNLKNLYQVNLDSVKTGFSFQNGSIEIENLDLHSCGISDINKLFIFNVGDLRVLDLRDNEIVKIDKFSFQSMPFLINLDLSLNRIDFIQPGSFLNVGGLRKLTLYGNNLQSLQFGIFDGIKALNFVNLSSNALQSFDAKLLPVASTIALDNNNIGNLSFEDFFESEVVKLSIGGNRISCKALAELKTSKYSKKFKEVIATATLNFHSENVDGITCESVSKGNRIILPVANNTSYDIGPMFIQFTNAIEKLRSSIEIVGNNTSPEKSYQIKPDLTKIFNSIQALVEISNKTQIKTADYMEQIENITNATQIHLEDTKEQIINLTDKTIDLQVNHDVYDNNNNRKSDDIRSAIKLMLKEEIDTIRGEFEKTYVKRDPIQQAQASEKEIKDDKVLYFIAAGLGIFMIWPIVVGLGRPIIVSFTLG
ncbi:Tartan/capricious-like protein [Operophtera brumata]|uniref:Tartan/capricious-like protein n=1 Tax=Operophtera brumata TaxID=104452 RepID=A0A0L7LNZ5_OPEBR|nr:Tartan/capricious-like protein [Operophtera brumata]